MAENIVILDYEAGNLTSVEVAVAHVGGNPLVTSDPEVIRGAARIIFPGVGAAPAVMDILNSSGLGEALRESVNRGVPTLGICIGAQVILESSEEGNATCLGLIKGSVIRLAEQSNDQSALKIPHMGWNDLNPVAAHPILKDIPACSQFYFVHSYHPAPADEKLIIGTTEYGKIFPSAYARSNLVATQFHPEKSGRVGLKLLENFLAWNGEY